MLLTVVSVLGGLLTGLAIGVLFAAPYVVWAKLRVRHYRRLMNEGASEDVSLRLH
jgi:hypothetical protein